MNFKEISQSESEELMLGMPGMALDINAHFQHILKQDVTLDVEPYATIPNGTPIFGEEQNGFIVFRFGEKNVQITKEYFV